MKENFSLFLSLFLLLIALPGCKQGESVSDAGDLATDQIADIYNPDDVEAEDGGVRDEGDRFIDSDKDGIPDKREEILGTDPLNPDTDGDGIIDGEELKDKTDPLNPASARLFHPEYNKRCKLFFDCEEEEGIREHIKKRVEEKIEPYITLFNRIRSIAEIKIPHYTEDFDTRISPVLGEIAETNAFLGWLYQNNDYIDKSLDAILEPFPDPTDVSASDKYNLYESEALVSFCTAYEFVRMSNLFSAERLQFARENLVRRIDYFREITHNGTYAVQLAFLNNNHKTKVLSALGFCALLFNDRKEAAFEISSAMTGIDFIMADFQNADGFYAEGPNYLVYTDNSFLPFMYAYHRFAKGEERLYYGIENISGGSPHSGKVVMIKDFAVNEKIINLYKRALFITQPDGLMLPLDDANPSCLHGAIHYRIFGNKDFLWQWYKHECGFNSNKLNTLSLTLLTDETPPENLSYIQMEGSYPEGGVAILRDSFDDSAIFFSFVGEHGKARTDGLGHEHPDELSFTLWAYGVPLVIDPGYINWDNHDKVKYAKDHSVILIDGEGAGYDAVRNQIGSDAFLGEFVKDELADYISGETYYKNSEIKRTVVRVHKKYFLLLDSVKFADENTHKVSIQINGAGGGDIPNSSFELKENGAIYARNGVSLYISVLSDKNNLSFSSRREEYAKSWGIFGYNDMFIPEAEGSGSIYFLTLLLPSKNISGNIVSERISDKLFYHNWSDDGNEYFAVLNTTGMLQKINLINQEVSVPEGLSIILFANGKETERKSIGF